MATWPASLPTMPIAGGYGEKPQSQVLRSDMDAGPAKTRRRFTAGTRELTYSLRMTQDQADTFEAFFDNQIAAGALPFDIEQPRTGATVSVLIKTGKGSPPYELTPIDSGTCQYLLSMTLEVQP